MNVKVNDIIKSYDFFQKTDCYIVGRVTSVETHYINFECLKIVSQNEVIDHTQYNTKMRTLKQGVLMTDEEFERVVVIA